MSITLAEFLTTADHDHAVALQQAKAYTANQGRYITSNTLAVYVVQLGLYSVLADTASMPMHAARDLCMAVIDRLRGASDFNFIVGTPMGDANLSLFDALVQKLPDSAEKLRQLKAIVTSYCNSQVKPFEHTTLHHVLTARGLCPTISAQPIGNWFVIEVSTVAEIYSPYLHGQNPRTLVWSTIGRFPAISSTGRYEFPLPAGEFSAYKIDDPHGEITCLTTL